MYDKLLVARSLYRSQFYRSQAFPNATLFLSLSIFLLATCFSQSMGQTSKPVLLPLNNGPLLPVVAKSQFKGASVATAVSNAPVGSELNNSANETRSLADLNRAMETVINSSSHSSPRQNSNTPVIPNGAELLLNQDVLPMLSQEFEPDGFASSNGLSSNNGISISESQDALDSLGGAVTTVGTSYLEQTPQRRLGMRFWNRKPQSRTLSFYGGWVFPVNKDFGRSYFYYSPNQQVNNGGAFLVSTGKQLSSRFRTELEFGYRNNKLDSSYSSYGSLVSSDALSISPYIGPTGSGEGEINTYTGMFNLIFDLDRAPGRRITPYLGAGIGLAYFDADFESRYGSPRSSSSAGFSFQAIAGLATRLTDKFDYLLEYRYVTTSEVDYCDELFGGYHASCRFELSNFFMGLRYKY